MTGSTVEANVGSKISFRWRGNPADDHVLGYRLYYGGDSRFKANGSLKSNFSYDYYIDFAELERCYPDSSGINCQLLDSEELRCKDLYGTYPSCTISNLHGHLYFALTAYNAQAESNFTPELYLTANPAGLAAVQQAISTLLLDKSN